MRYIGRYSNLIIIKLSNCINVKFCNTLVHNYTELKCKTDITNK